MAKSSIEWTDFSWNPTVGCKMVSPGCAHCYAEVIARRLKEMRLIEYQDVIGENGRWTGRAAAIPKRLSEPLKWKNPSRIFVDSMSDLFHDDISDSFIDQVFETMHRAHWHRFQILTKRPARMAEYINARYAPGRSWPLPNVWLGVSVENQAAARERIPLLLDTMAVVRFLSCEPLLEPLQLGEFLGRREPDGRGGDDSMIHWVIVGGESGQHARPMDIEWARDLLAQCRRAGVRFFMKQLGGFPDRRGQLEDFPVDLRVREEPQDAPKP